VCIAKIKLITKLVKKHLTLLCSALCRGQLKRKVLKTGTHILSPSTVRYTSVNSNAAGYWFHSCHTQSRNSRNTGDCRQKQYEQ